MKLLLHESNNSNQDNQGNPLTIEQQKYFKNSKVRDKSGHLMVCYHGTTNPSFTEFNGSLGNSRFGKYKFRNNNVNYFTSSKETARGYTDIGVERDNNIYYCYINIENPYIVDNTTEDEFRSWKTIKDKQIRDKEISTFKKFWSYWEYNINFTEDDLEDINDVLYNFNRKLELNTDYDDEEEYYDLIALEQNTLFGNEYTILRAYKLEELFDDDMYEEFRDAVVGDFELDPDDYTYTMDNIVKWVLLMNREDGTNYDGIIVEDIWDIGPEGSIFTPRSTDVITLKSSNQIKSITNKNPSSSNNINESK